MIAACRNNSEHGANRKAHCVCVFGNAMAFCSAEPHIRNMCECIIGGDSPCSSTVCTIQTLCALVLMETYRTEWLTGCSIHVDSCGRHRPTAEEVVWLSWFEIWKYLAYHDHFGELYSPSSFLKSRFSQSISFDLHRQRCFEWVQVCDNLLVIASRDYCLVRFSQCATHSASKAHRQLLK